MRDKLEETIVIESLDPFFSMLKNKDREFWFREEIDGRERIGLKRVDDKNFMQLVFA